MDNRTDTLIRASELYYLQKLSQNAIAQMLDTSRPTVSRMLEEARELGIVEIIVHSPVKKDHELSCLVREALGLKETIVISGDYSYEESLERCGKAVAHFLYGILDNNLNIGISWGIATEFLAKALEFKEYHNINVLQMVGCLGTGNPRIDGLELALTISKKLNGFYTNIYAPLYVESEIAASYLLKEPQIEAALRRAMHTDIVLTGIGSLDEKSSLQISGYLSESDWRTLRTQGAVGHLLGRMIDKNGKEVPFEKGKNIIGAPLEALRNAKWSIGMSASEFKAEATVAAVRAGYINMLVIDQALAQKIMSMAEKGRLL